MRQGVGAHRHRILVRGIGPRAQRRGTRCSSLGAVTHGGSADASGLGPIAYGNASRGAAHCSGLIANGDAVDAFRLRRAADNHRMVCRCSRSVTNGNGAIARCSATHGNGHTPTGFRPVTQGGGRVPTGSSVVAGGQCVDAGRTVVVVVTARRAGAVVHTEIVDLRGFQLSHVHYVAIGSTSRHAGDLAVLLGGGNGVADTHGTQRALGGVDGRGLRRIRAGGHIARHARSGTGHRLGAQRYPLVHVGLRQAAECD
ncbi:hypothetical protein D9M68_523080 [compost metagenome]